jgi:hypothetical protein
MKHVFHYIILYLSYKSEVGLYSKYAPIILQVRADYTPSTRRLYSKYAPIILQVRAERVKNRHKPFLCQFSDKLSRSCANLVTSDRTNDQHVVTDVSRQLWERRRNAGDVPHPRRLLVRHPLSQAPPAPRRAIKGRLSS